MKIRSFTVSAPEEGMALADFLARRLESSRGKAKGLLDARAVWVNGRRIWMARHRLGARDEIRVTVAEGAGEARDRASVPLLYRDGDCLVADKPAGLLSNEKDSVEARLRQRSPEYADVRAVHRLDRDTSGCLILAVHAAAREALVRAFRERQVSKTYCALVWGRPPREADRLVSTMDGGRAVSHVRMVSASRRASFLHVRIETGRTHQIRRHLREMGCPVVGDRQYGHARSDWQTDIAPRQMLHAWQVAFPHPRESRAVRVMAPLPRDFARAMQALNLKAAYAGSADRRR
jgi:23S rRNA pseudouridine1911/1915/1917 synthase